MTDDMALAVMDTIRAIRASDDVSRYANDARRRKTATRRIVAEVAGDYGLDADDLAAAIVEMMDGGSARTGETP